MTLNTLRLTRNILLRCFALGFGMTLFLGFACFGLWDSWIGPACTVAHTTQSAIVPVVMNFFADLRIVMLYFLLIPALAIHWTLRREQGRIPTTDVKERMQTQVYR